MPTRRRSYKKRTTTRRYRRRPYAARRKYKTRSRSRYAALRRTTTTTVRDINTADRLRVKLRYVSYLVGTTSVTAAYNIFNGNNLFDPDRTGVGHQPRGFDQYATQYRNYCVYASRIKITTFNGEAGSNLITVITPAKPAAATPIDATVDLAIERRESKWTSTVFGGRPTVLSNYATTAAMHGESKKTIAINPDFSAPTSGAPPNQWSWIVQVQDCTLGTSCDFTIYAEITYYCEFFDRIPVGPS